MTKYEALRLELPARPKHWLVTGAAGFIGSHLVETLLGLGQRVMGLDNFTTGSRANLEDVHAQVGDEAWTRFEFIEGDITDLPTCRRSCEGVDYVLHQAALGSVPRSIADPTATHRSNVDGFVNMLVAARDALVRRFVYASSSSVYGDCPELPKVEERTGRPLSPYAVTKCVDELYGGVWERTYALQTLGLRYFNVFGPRQDPNGAYAAVIPRWISALLAHETCHINGDGQTSRDFCYVANVVQANLLAATVEGERVTGEVYNVACGARTSLLELFALIRDRLALRQPEIARARPFLGDFRPGDVRHSHADIGKIGDRLEYVVTHQLEQGMVCTLDWHLDRRPREADRPGLKSLS